MFFNSLALQEWLLSLDLFFSVTVFVERRLSVSVGGMSPVRNLTLWR